MTIEIIEGRGCGPHKHHILLHLEHLGAERWSGLEVAEHRFAAPVDYGY